MSDKIPYACNACGKPSIWEYKDLWWCEDCIPPVEPTRIVAGQLAQGYMKAMAYRESLLTQKLMALQREQGNYEDLLARYKILQKKYNELFELYTSTKNESDGHV